MTALTNTDQMLLDILGKGDWMTRTEINQHLPLSGGKEKPLNPYEIDRLEMLVENGLVERSERPFGRVRKVFIYRKVKE